MRENLDNKDIIVNATDYFFTTNNLSNKFGQSSMFINGFDYELNEQININNLYGWYMPQLKYSFTNQYVEDDRWYFDLDISTRINWGFNFYSGNYDYNKLIWNNINNLAFIVSGKYYGLNNIFVSENNYINSIVPFTIHGSTEETGLYSNSSWPKNQAKNKLGRYELEYINNFSIYNYIEKEKYIHNFQNFTNGIPIREWIGIYNINTWKFIDNSSIFELGRGYAYFGEPLNYFYGNYNYYSSSMVPKSNRQYNIIAYMDNNIIGIIPDQHYDKYNFVYLSSGKELKKSGNHFNNWVDIYNNKNIYATGSKFSYYHSFDMALKPMWEQNQYRLRYYLRNYDSNSFWYSNNTNNVYINYGEKFFNPPDDKNVFDGYHFVSWHSPTENNRIVDIENEYFYKEFNHNSDYDLVADYEPNIYTVLYKNNIDSQDNYAVQIYNHKERIFIPKEAPNKEQEGLVFNGWYFNNGKKLINAYYLCNKNYVFTAAWDGATFNVNYSMQYFNEEINLELKNITDSWNNQSQNLSKDKDICYLKQIAQPNLGYYSGVCWQDIETKQCYIPGQRINHSVNLVAIDSRLNNDEILALPLSIFDKEMIKNERITWCSFGRMTDTGYQFDFKQPSQTKIFNSYELCYGDSFNNLISQSGSGYINRERYTVNNIIENSLELLSPVKFYFVEKNNFGKKYGQMLPIPFKPGYIFNGWWYLNEKFTDNKGYCVVTNYKDYNFQGLSILNESLIQVNNNVFIPEFINLKNNQYYHFPFVLTNRNNNIEEVNFNDYSRLYTTKWLNENTTFNESYHFPALFIPYKE